MTGRKTPHAVAFVLLLLLACCSEQEVAITQAIVAMTAEAELGLRAVQVALYPRDAVEGSEASATRSIPVQQSTDGQALKMSFGIQRREARELLVVVRGCADEACTQFVAEQKLYLLFQNKRTVQLSVLLTRSCADASLRCTSLHQTCTALTREGSSAGSCVPIPLPQGVVVEPGDEVYAVLPESSPPDGSPLDAGPRETAIDAQVDARSESDCPVDNNCLPDYPCERDQGKG